jgi:hypothetical protein
MLRVAVRARCAAQLACGRASSLPQARVQGVRHLHATGAARNLEDFGEVISNVSVEP